jgi:Arc/MetJ family transcription regulator
VARDHIENLLYRYAAYADELDAEALGDLLANAILRSHGGVEVSGREAIRRHLASLFATVTASRHMMANVRIDVDDETGTATAHCLYNKWVLEAVGPALDAVGRYRSEFRWTGEHWEFTEHVVNSEWRRGQGTPTSATKADTPR